MSRLLFYVLFIGGFVLWVKWMQFRHERGDFDQDYE